MHNKNTIQFVREPIQSRKALSLVLHRLAHGTSTYIIAELYCVGEWTARKYTMVIVDIILQNLQNEYINILCGSRLQNILSNFIHMMFTYAKIESLSDLQTFKEWWKFPR